MFGVIVEDLKAGAEEFKQFDAERLKQAEERIKTEEQEKVVKTSSTKSKPRKEESSEEEEEARKPAKPAYNKSAKND